MRKNAVMVGPDPTIHAVPAGQAAFAAEQPTSKPAQARPNRVDPRVKSGDGRPGIWSFTP